MPSGPENESREAVHMNMRSGFSIGQEVGGRYEILSHLGEGGMGLVYRVRQVFLNKEFAFKTIDKHELSELAIRRFQQEARTTFALNHPNIIKVNDFGVLDDQTPFLVMELIKGETFGERLKRGGVLSFEQALPIFVQVCFGLAYAHEQGIVHRDIKPSNLMFVENVPAGADGSIKILDFGIAKLIEHEGGEIQALTRTGQVFGSPLYMSPEQCSGAKSDLRSDIYSLGCVFYELLTGAPPCVGETALVTMMKHQIEAPLTLKQASLGLDFPEPLENIVANMLAKRPEDRYQNLGLVANDLGALLRGRSVSTGLKLRKSAPSAKSKAGHISMTGRSFFALLVATAALAFSGGFFIGKVRTKNATVLQTEQSVPEAVRSLPKDAEPLDAYEKKELTNSELRRLLALRGAKNVLLIRSSTLSDAMLKSIGSISEINDLALHDCVFKGESLRHLSKLRRFNCHNSVLDDAGVNELCKFPNLTEINVTATNLSQGNLMKLATIKSLNDVYIGETQADDIVLLAMLRLPKLDVLDLRNDRRITSQGFSALSTATLSWLSLESTRVDDAALVGVAKIQNLKRIYLGSTSVSFNGLKTLCNNNHMLLVNLSNCPSVKADDLSALIHAFPLVKFETKKSDGASYDDAIETLTKF